jgi:hypothetical protein
VTVDAPPSQPPAASSDILASATTSRNGLERRPVSAVDRRCPDGARGSLPDLCSRGVRPSRSLTDGAGGFLPGVPLGCLGIASKRWRQRRHSSIASRPAAVIRRRRTSIGLAPAFVVSRSAVAPRTF